MHCFGTPRPSTTFCARALQHKRDTTRPAPAFCRQAMQRNYQRTDKTPCFGAGAGRRGSVCLGLCAARVRRGWARTKSHASSLRLSGQTALSCTPPTHSAKLCHQCSSSRPATRGAGYTHAHGRSSCPKPAFSFGSYYMLPAMCMHAWFRGPERPAHGWPENRQGGLTRSGPSGQSQAGPHAQEYHADGRRPRFRSGGGWSPSHLPLPTSPWLSPTLPFPSRCPQDLACGADGVPWSDTTCPLIGIHTNSGPASTVHIPVSLWFPRGLAAALPQWGS